MHTYLLCVLNTLQYVAIFCDTLHKWYYWHVKSLRYWLLHTPVLRYWRYTPNPNTYVCTYTYIRTYIHTNIQTYLHNEYCCPDIHFRISLISVPKLQPLYNCELGLPPLCRATGTNIPLTSFNTGEPDDPFEVPLLYNNNGPAYVCMYIKF